MQRSITPAGTQSSASEGRSKTPQLEISLYSASRLSWGFARINILRFEALWRFWGYSCSGKIPADARADSCLAS